MNSFGSFPNVLHSDKWKITFSNIPSLDDMSEMRYFDNYVKSCTIPNYSMGQIISKHPLGFDIRHPLGGMKINQDLNQINLTFKLSEDMYNYLILFKWIQQLRYGQIDPRHDDFFRKYVIKKLVISMLDNQKRTVAELHFTNLFLLDLGSLDLNFGSTDELAFTTSFSYEEILYDIKNPLEGGKELDAPENIIECGTSGVPVNPIVDWEHN